MMLKNIDFYATQEVFFWLYVFTCRAKAQTWLDLDNCYFTKLYKKHLKKKIYYPSRFDTSQRKYCEIDLLTSSQLLMLDFQLSRLRVKQGD